MNLLIGTSGFSYKDWKGHFYPESIKNSEMLSYYSRHFSCVELNVSYYTIPSASSFEIMNNKTPDNFEFIVKVNQETTHIRRQNEMALKNLVESVNPLIDAGKLAGFLAQFPYSFHNTEKNRKYLLQTREYVRDIPLFVEFRNNSWVKNATTEFLKSNAIGYVNVDEPQLKGLIPAQQIVTSTMGYVRFHGRNREKWWDGTGSERYEYDYSSEQLQEWLVRVSDILKKSYKTYVFFNNHPQGKAPANALAFEKMIRQYLD
jgi:uncharacterized protein YecE (DUF72 family)